MHTEDDLIKVLEMAERGALPKRIDAASSVSLAIIRELLDVGELHAIDASSADGPAFLDAGITGEGRATLKQYRIAHEADNTKLGAEAWEVIRAFQSDDTAAIEGFTVEQIAKAEEKQGDRDYNVPFRIAMRNEVDERRRQQDKKEAREARSRDRAKDWFVGILLVFLGAAVAARLRGFRVTDAADTFTARVRTSAHPGHGSNTPRSRYRRGAGAAGRLPLAWRGRMFAWIRSTVSAAT